MPEPLALDYAPRPRRRSMLRWWKVFTTVSIVAASVSFALPTLSHSRYFDNRARCASRLRQIGQAMYVYAIEHGGRYPNHFDELIVSFEHGDFASVLCCPSTNDTIATGPTIQAVAANLCAGGHLSFVYAAKGVTSTVSADTVLAYEPLTNHGDGINVLWGDGYVEFHRGAGATQIIAQLESDANPPKRK